MPYTRAKGRDFWFDFDNATLFQRTPEIADAMNRAYFVTNLTFDSIMRGLRLSFARDDHPTQFLAMVQVGQQGFLDLAQLLFGIMESRLEDPAGIQSAFEDFGQGVLFDNRPGRPPGRQIHMMDGTPADWVGYHRFHAFARAAVLLGADEHNWLHVNRCIALAWAIQSEANPQVDNQNNPGLPAARLDELRSSWMPAPVERLDWAFVNNRGPAPTATLLNGAHAQQGRYAKVQQLLSAAATDGHPTHLGPTFTPLGRFWEVPYASFMALTTIYDVQLIAAPGADRGKKSGLVMALRGELDDFPQMPLNRPPMDPADILFIEQWIDAGLPEL